MEQVSYGKNDKQLNAVFSALADPTRRAILTRLLNGQASVSELAEPFAMSQPAISRHLKVLHKAGLVEREVDEQRRPAKLSAQQMAAAVSWMEQFRAFWEGSFDQLDNLLWQLQDNPATVNPAAHPTAYPTAYPTAHPDAKTEPAKHNQAANPGTQPKPRYRLRANQPKETGHE